MLNRFCLLNKKTPTFLFSMDYIKMDRIETKIKWKIHAFFTWYFKFWKVFLLTVYKIQPPDLLFLVFISFNIRRYNFFCKFLELHSTMSDKKIFVTNVPFLTDSLKPLPLHPHPLNSQNLVSITKLFGDTPLNRNQYFMSQILTWEC